MAYETNAAFCQTCGATRRDRAPVPLLTNYPHLLSTIQHPKCERTLPGASSFHCRAALTSTANHTGQNERGKAILSEIRRVNAQIDDAGRFDDAHVTP